VLVGDFDPAQAMAYAEKYLGSIPRGSRPAPEMITTEPPQVLEKRVYGEAETNPTVEIQWHTVAQVHKDVPALTVLEAMLNGPTGRLQKHLVLGGGAATSARANQDSRKYEGAFSIQAEAKDGHQPDELERAIYAELDSVARNGVPAEELSAVKNRYLTSTYRQLDSDFALMIRYGVADARGEWRDADRIDAAVQQVTSADVQAMVKRYFTRENRAVATWTRKAGSEPEDPALAGLPEQSKGMVKGMLTRIKSSQDPAQLQRMLDRMDQMGAQAGPEMKAGLDLVRARIQARIAELGAAKK
jgi:zinc protease